MFALCFVVVCLVSYLIGGISLVGGGGGGGADCFALVVWLCSFCFVAIGVSSSLCIGLVCGLCLLYFQVIITCFFGKSSNSSTIVDPGFLKRGVCTGMVKAWSLLC